MVASHCGCFIVQMVIGCSQTKRRISAVESNAEKTGSLLELNRIEPDSKKAGNRIVVRFPAFVFLVFGGGGGN